MQRLSMKVLRTYFESAVGEFGNALSENA